MRVSGLYIYPVKSLRGYAVESAAVEQRGFRWDRRFMVVRPDGSFLTQRELPAMGAVVATIEDDELVLRHAKQGTIRTPAVLRGERALDVRVWGSEVRAERVSDMLDAWLSSALGASVRLVVMPEGEHRPVDPAFNRGADEVSFADGYPYLVIGDASLDDLNGRLESPITMERFRPNITVAGTPAFAEDDWRSIRIGTQPFQAVKLCVRCSIPTIDPDTGEKGKEPLATLATYRKVDDGVTVGMNLVPDGLVPDDVVPKPKTEIRVGDPVSIEE